MSNTAIEVITSVERRRRWSAADKERWVTASLQPGSSVSAVSRQAKIHPSQLYGWRRQLGVRRGATPGFAAVRVAAEPLPAGMFTPGTIEVEFANGSRMRITGSVDPATLAAAVSVLNGAGRR